MDCLIVKALEIINHRIRFLSGVNTPALSHPDDIDAVTELFTRMSHYGISLMPEGIESWARNNGWLSQSARELGDLARSVNSGGNQPVSKAPFWKENIVEILKAKSAAAAKPLGLISEGNKSCMMRVSDSKGSVECLMEFMGEALGEMRCCDCVATEPLAELASFPQIIPL